MSVRSVLRGAAEQVLVRLPRTTKPGDRLILAYHNVVPNDWTPRGDVSLHMPLHKFEAQLRMIRNEAEIVPLMELLTTDAPNDRRVAITFDDAYASAMELGVGACVAAGAACTVFVAPGLLGTVPVWDRRAIAGGWSAADRDAFLWKMNGREEKAGDASSKDDALRIATFDSLMSDVRCIGASLSLGNHTDTHPNLATLDTSEVQLELERTQQWLRTHAAERLVPVVAYPYGHAPKTEGWMNRENDSLPEWGLLATGGWIRRGDPLLQQAVARWNVPSGISADGFASRLRGTAGGG